MLQQGGLVGRVVTSGADAISAAAEGADLILLEVCSAVLHAYKHFALAHDDHEPYALLTMHHIMSQLGTTSVSGHPFETHHQTGIYSSIVYSRLLYIQLGT